ncbi:hypothetical protein HF086_014285 [Spodoptera exigua]|uniref:FLYWCH-type domain-containing protein n=1 Tax=Spodoptera exigua TaxID=7107 RepID=A0A922M7V2_SPOEX|nr:hypothetical protein HF086_014285 [Spodoptera exigua]
MNGRKTRWRCATHERWRCIVADYEYTKRGTKILVLNGIKYRLSGKTANKIWWRCATHEKYRCKSVVHMVEDIIVHYYDNHTTDVMAVFDYTRRGTKILILDGIKYRCNGMTGNKVWWRCSTHEKWRCKSIVHTVDDIIVRYMNEHTTGSQGSSVVAEYEYSKRGSKILVVNGLKFRLQGMNGCKVRWRCASHEKWRCKSVVHTIDDVIVRYLNQHTTGSY